MKITTRHQLIEEIARRIYEDARINDLEEYRDGARDWKSAEAIVEFFIDDAHQEPLWSKQIKDEDYSKFRHFVRNYEDNATDNERVKSLH